MLNTMQGLTIDNTMQYMHWKRRNKCTQNKLILLFQTKKIQINLKRRFICSSYVRRMTWQNAINKLKNTLSKKIRLYLHSSIKIIGVCKLQRDNVLSVRKRNICHNKSLHGSNSLDNSNSNNSSDGWVQNKRKGRGLHRWWRRRRQHEQQDWSPFEKRKEKNFYVF